MARRGKSFRARQNHPRTLQCRNRNAAGFTRLRGPDCPAYLLDEEDDPPGPLEAAEPPVVPPLDEAAPPLPELLVPPVEPPGLLLEELPGLLLEELEDPGVLGVVDDEDDDPPGTMIVSFSFVTVEVGGDAAPPGTTVVVSLRSQADRAKAPIRTNR